MKYATLIAIPLILAGGCGREPAETLQECCLRLEASEWVFVSEDKAFGQPYVEYERRTPNAIVHLTASASGGRISLISATAYPTEPTTDAFLCFHDCLDGINLIRPFGKAAIHAWLGLHEAAGPGVPREEGIRHTSDGWRVTVIRYKPPENPNEPLPRVMVTAMRIFVGE